ncbi:hypothetical protein [Schlesneria sp.]|uniref:hypothetical protein n=1 Tax=Schlesneria sp. TaxID=2762018 RepID=UPI002EE743B3
MITLRELATTLAALMFWKDEIAQGGNQSARPYLKGVGMRGIKPLNADEIEQLAAKLRSLPLSE